MILENEHVLESNSVSDLDDDLRDLPHPLQDALIMSFA